MAFGFFTNETYSFNDSQARWPSTQYIRDIMLHGIRCNIVDIANQLFFSYQGLAPELRLFVSAPIKSTKIADFICVLKKK